ncbi:hypothetical protein BH11ACT6_BH11ACT6_39130 [soil metagenome]
MHITTSAEGVTHGAHQIESRSLTRTGASTTLYSHFAVVAYGWSMVAKPDPAEIDDVEPLADSTASQARRVVAAYATDADECRVFLSMLGIGATKLGA